MSWYHGARGWIRKRLKQLVDFTIPTASDQEFDPQGMRSAFAGAYAFALMAIVIWAFLQPVLQMMDELFVLMLGLAVCAVLLLLHLVYTFKSRGARAICVYLAGAILICTSYVMIDEVEHKQLSSAANDLRCRAIQADMLSATPRRTDGAALFEALRCKPEGFGPVAFPSSPAPATPQPAE